MFFDGEKRENDAGCFAGKEKTGDGVAVDGVIFVIGVVVEKQSDAVAESRRREVQQGGERGNGRVVNNEDFGGFFPLCAGVVNGYCHD